LVRAALERQGKGFVGMIGSSTKSQHFRRRLSKLGMQATLVSRLCCPVGMREVSGKHPMEVAISICAQLVARHNSSLDGQSHKGIDWRSLNIE